MEFSIRTTFRFPKLGMKRDCAFYGVLLELPILSRNKCMLT